MDFVAPDRPLAVEVDSAIHHAALPDRRRGGLRTERLRPQGWVVLRLDEDDVWNRPGKVIDQLIAARHLAGR